MIGHKVLRNASVKKLLAFDFSTLLSTPNMKYSHSAVQKVNPIIQRVMSNSTASQLNAPELKPTCSEDNIVWIDMEMTGLVPEVDHVLEVACLVTDSQLNVIGEGIDLVIHQPQHVLDNMNEWSTKQHALSGLTQKCKESEISLKDAEEQLLKFVRAWTPSNKCPLGGNTVYMDRLFLMKHLPQFEKHMHYRIIDVSSIKELCRRWFPEVYSSQPNKKELSKHRALEDIIASIEELKFYRDKVFKKPEVSNVISWC